MRYFIEMAYQATEHSTHPHHKMACVVVKGGRILAVEHNLGKWNACCERRALRPHRDFSGATLIVVRSTGGISKPCVDCHKAIQKAGIKRVVYVDRNRQLTFERVFRD